MSEDDGGEAKGSISKSSVSKENQMSEVFIYINEKYAPSSHTISVKPYIFRVNELQHRENKRAYEPEILAIGPYHRNKDHLKMMEGHKLCYIQEFLKRRNEPSLGSYVKAMEELEEKARNCYVDPIQLTKKEFVEMMLVDGIFIMELLRGKMDILQSDRIQNILVRDILLFENQLPLFVLNRLSDVVNERNFSVERAFRICIHWRFILIRHTKFKVPSREVDLHHLLGVMHYATRPSFLDDMPYVMGPSFLDYSRGDSMCPSKLTRCVIELQDFGIKFEEDLSSKSWMDIEFKNGIMKIPSFFIDDDTELILRNLIAYEQYNHENEWMYVSSYVKFMNCLIKSLVDVKILRQSKHFRISGRMDDESTFSMFNKLSGAVTLPNSGFCYYKICNKIKRHCERRWNRWMAKWRHNWRIWMAKLKQDYFNSPWSVIKLIAAFVLLVFTAIQAVCSILQVQS